MTDNYFRIYVSDLSEYTNGRLNGEWLSLPLDDDDLIDTLDRIRVNEDDELFIADCENSFGYEVGEYENIEDLNNLASEIIDYDDEQTAVFNACMENGMEIDDAVKLIDNRDYYAFQDVHDMSDVAYYYIEESGILDGVPETISRYFDYEAYGRDMEIEGTFVDTDYGFIELIY